VVSSPNYAASWVNRLFGTLYLPEDKQPARYGIDEPLPTSFLGQLVRPFLISPGRTDSQPEAADPAAVPSGKAGVVPRKELSS